MAEAPRKRRKIHTLRLCSLWIEPEIAARLDALSQREGRAQAELRRDALREYLAKRKA